MESNDQSTTAEFNLETDVTRVRPSVPPPNTEQFKDCSNPVQMAFGNCGTCTKCKGEQTEDKTMHLDNTKRHCFVECRRKYYLQYVLNLKTFFGSTALRYGLTWHAGQDAYYQTIKELGWDGSSQAMANAFEAMKKEWFEACAKENFREDYRTLENCCQSFIEYVNHFAVDRQTVKVLNTEEPFKIHMEIEDEEEEKYFRGLVPFHFTGKIDAEIDLSGRNWINEHKTTGQPIDTQVNRLTRSAQVIGYFYGKLRMHRADSLDELKQAGEVPEGVLMTVHHLSARKSTAAGKEGLYGKPKIEFRRVPQVLSDNDIVQWRRSFLSTALDIQRENERGLWPMNHDACFDYGSCPFLSICEQNSNVDEIWLDETRFYVAEPWEVAKSITASGIIY